MKPDANSRTAVRDLIDRSREAKKVRTQTRASTGINIPFLAQEDDDDLPDDDDDEGLERSPTVIERTSPSTDDTSTTEPPLPELGRMKIGESVSPSQGPLASKKYNFKAERICRIGITVNCAEFWGNYVFHSVIVRVMSMLNVIILCRRYIIVWDR